MTNKTQKIERLSSEALALLNDLLNEDFSPIEIKELMEDGKALKKLGISGEIAEEICLFLLRNWKEIQKIGV